ncbi:MAG: GDP-mannose 4,6-dehydratase [Candidatus Thorarchaeota archaeon]|jgi:UDP-glucose 4-epimerase
MVETALVTGCAGFIGSNLVDHLLDKGYSVIGLDNFSIGLERNLESALMNPGFKLVTADVLDEDLAMHFDSKIDVIYHLAAISSVKRSMEEPLLVHNNNATGTLKVLELARQIQVRRIVFSSSAAVYGMPDKLPVTEETPVEPLSPYAASKLAAEMYLRSYRNTYGIETVILRYFNIYGPRQIFSEYSGVVSIFSNQALQDMPVTVDGHGLQTRSLIHIDDVLEVTRLAGESSRAAGETLNVAGTNSISVLELAKRILALMPDSESSIIHGPARRGDIKESSSSMKRTKEVLGFTPAVALDDGLERTVDWYRDYLRS